MQRTSTVLLSTMLCYAIFAQHTELIQNTMSQATAATEEVVIHPVHHSAMVLEWRGQTILVDPHAGAERFKQFASPAVILITDIHGDHMDPATLNALDLSITRIVAPRAVVEALPLELSKHCTTLANGERVEIAGIVVEAVPMYNMPDPNDPRHPKGRGNGYVVTLGAERIYISGDTEDIPEMRALKNIDVAFVCMNLPYTMTVDQAASGVLAFKPRVVYAYHYRGTDGLSDVARFKQLVNASDPKIEVRLEDWYAE
ncbi:MAG: MBL fold metallo-hydrolase [Flavobacteriales bacterium]|nr:MBL fold metallo-hydrolase [Flavobacteriales bacterium]